MVILGFGSQAPKIARPSSCKGKSGGFLREMIPKIPTRTFVTGALCRRPPGFRPLGKGFAVEFTDDNSLATMALEFISYSLSGASCTLVLKKGRLCSQRTVETPKKNHTRNDLSKMPVPMFILLPCQAWAIFSKTHQRRNYGMTSQQEAGTLATSQAYRSTKSP